VLLLNRGPLAGVKGEPTGCPITVHWATLGLASDVPMSVRDVLAKADRGVSVGSLTVVVAPHDVAFFRLSRHVSTIEEVAQSEADIRIDQEPVVDSLDEAQRLIEVLRAEVKQVRSQTDTHTPVGLI
jgi:hypothetical protein